MGKMKNFPKTVYLENNVAYSNVCCHELQEDNDIGYQGGKWQTFCEGCFHAYIKYCPYCGDKLNEKL